MATNANAVTATAAKPARKGNAASKAVVTAPNATPETAALTPADKLAAALAGLKVPAAHNGAAWLALIAEMPEIAAIVAASRGGKYGEKGKGLVNNPGEMLALTPYGAQLGTAGYKKNGRPNAQAAICRAMQKAQAATGETTVCAAAVTFYALTDTDTLALLRACKAVQYVARATPCPAWVRGYINGNVREDMFNRK